MKDISRIFRFQDGITQIDMVYCKLSMFLWFAGDGSDYLLIQLLEGGVSLTVNQRSGRLDTAVRPAGEPFNDNVWHQVELLRCADWAALRGAGDRGPGDQPAGGRPDCLPGILNTDCSVILQ